MKNTARNSLKYLLWIVVLCGVIPHAALSIIQALSASEAFSPAELDSYKRFFTREWMPFWAAFLSYRGQQKTDDVSALYVLSTSAVIATFLPRCDRQTVMAMALVLPLTLFLEMFALLKKADASENVILAGLAADRGMLRTFFFWTVVIPCLAHISCAWMQGIVVPLILLPVPAALLVGSWRQLKEQPPTLGGIVAVLLMLPITCVLAATGPMENFKLYHLMIFMAGYILFFLFQGVYHMDRWCRVRKVQ